MRSRLYTGRVTHERVRPARNSFSYPVYYLALDIDELDAVDSSLKWFSHNRRNLVSFWDRDHGPRDGSALRPWIDAVVARAGVDLTGGRVVLLTFPRVMSARFYPVSFWYCFSADGVPRAVLAEVQNTFRDHHNYLLHNHGAPLEWPARHGAEKVFYVSPFMQIDEVAYSFTFSEPADRIAVKIVDLIDSRPVLSASIALAVADLTDPALLGTVLRHGPISAVALIRIHWQALKLLLKRVPFHARVAAPIEETSL